MCDEVELAERARRRLADYSLVPTAKEIRELGRRTDADLAARLFHEVILSLHDKFIRTLNGLPGDRILRPRTDIKILVLPGMFYRQHPEVGADGHLIIEIARRWGFDVEWLALDGTGSVTSNSRMLHERLRTITGKDVWLFSLSKGSSDVRHCLQNRPLNPWIKGWVSVAGIYGGSPLADGKVSSRFRRVLSRMLCRLVGVDFEALLEMSTQHPYWRRTEWPSQIEMIHIVPVPLAAHVQGALRTRHREMSRLGPNDGFVPVTDVLSIPGHVYTVWGCDHFLRTPELSPLLHRLLTYISTSYNQGEVSS